MLRELTLMIKLLIHVIQDLILLGTMSVCADQMENGVGNLRYALVCIYVCVCVLCMYVCIMYECCTYTT